MYNHSWPGNVRELKNVIERASVLSDTDEIKADSILISHDTTTQDGDRGYPDNPDRSGQSLKARVGSYEAKLLMDTLNVSASIRQAAKKLSISHTALLRKIDKYQLQAETKKNQWSIKEPQI